MRALERAGDFRPVEAPEPSRLSIEVLERGSSIGGRVVDAAGEVRTFENWLGLIAALEAAIARHGSDDCEAAAP